MNKKIIAIDGPAASGKGTLAKRLASHYSFAHLETGALYRTLAYRLLAEGYDRSTLTEKLAGNGATAMPAVFFLEMQGSPLLRSEKIGNFAAFISSMKSVRSALLFQQQHFAETPPNGAKGAVLDGRDIGTIICPEAAFKIFLTANVKIRAERRHKELLDAGRNVSFEAILQDLTLRDEADQKRSLAPLIAADDAFIIDSTEFSADEVFAKICHWIDKKASSSSLEY